MLRTRSLLPLILLLALPVVTTSCRDVFNDDASAAPQPPVLSLDDDALRNGLRTLLTDSGPVQERLATACRGYDTLAQFYRARGYTARWIGEDGPTAEFAVAWRYFARSEEHGISPARYHAHSIEELLASLYTAGEAERHILAAEAELLISDAVLRYAYDLRFGLFDPARLDPEAYHLPVRRRTAGAWLEPLQDDDIATYLASVQPKEERYRRLSQALERYRRLGREHTWPFIAPLATDKLEPGDTSSVLGAVARRLMLSGAWTGGWPALPPYASELDRVMEQSAPWGDAFYNTMPLRYDSTLVNAVMRFQRMHGLLVDGILGKNTIAVLNTPPDDVVRTMALNLERFRWLRYPENGRYVMVNIPDFRLFAMDGGAVQATMAVCVGERRSPYYYDQLQQYYQTGQKHFQPKNHETPQIHGNFKHFILNPFWYVPHSIGARELYYDAKRDSTFLRRKRYRVYYKDSLVMPESINWTKYSPTNLPFKFRQDPGEGNALGRIKFPFDNDFSIYLHDTPMRMPFRRAIRAVSHGCVRIENPMAFVKYLLDGTPDWDVAKVQRAIWSGQRSKVVYLKRSTPVYLDYYTAWVDDDGTLQLRGDVYRKDARLASVFASRAPGALIP